MSTNEERREAARKKLEERLEREKQAARKRRMSLIALSGVVVVAIAAVGGFFWYRAWDNGRHTTCNYEDAPANWNDIIASVEQQVKAAPADQKAQGEAYLAMLREGSKKARTSPKPGDRTLNTGTAAMTLTTNKGDVDIELDRSLAACNVNAVESLAGDGYYDGTACHRLTASANLSVLQCGDPTGTGSGAPGWTSPDENPTNLKKVPVDPQMAAMGMPETVVYPRGTVAIANSNSEQEGRTNTGSAQFFIVTKDSQLSPTLAVVGKVDEKGMKAIDETAKGGIDPGPLGTAENGRPKTPLEIKKATVSS